MKMSHRYCVLVRDASARYCSICSTIYSPRHRCAVRQDIDASLRIYCGELPFVMLKLSIREETDSAQHIAIWASAWPQLTAHAPAEVRDPASDNATREGAAHRALAD